MSPVSRLYWSLLGLQLALTVAAFGLVAATVFGCGDIAAAAARVVTILLAVLLAASVALVISLPPGRP